MRSQTTALLSRPHIVIATPGRMADHIETSNEELKASLKRVRMCVLDEADRLLDPQAGFLPDLNTCLGALPPTVERQTCLFTATLTPEVLALKDLPRPKGRQAIYVCEISAPLAIPDTLLQSYVQVPVTYREVRHSVPSTLLVVL